MIEAVAGTASSVLRLVARNRQLRRVELAFAAFSSGEWATWVAALVYAYAQGGVTESGVVGAVLLLPAVVHAPVLAAVGARFAPGQALALGYVAQAAMCAAAAGALLADAPRLVVYLFLVGPTVAFTLTRPTQSAFAPGLARRPEELTATNVVSVWIESASMLAAPALAGVVLAGGSPGGVYALAAAASSVGALLVAPLRKAVPAPVRDAGPVAADGSPLAGSIAFVWRDPHARIL